MPFAHALEATAARGQEMTRVSVADPGWMAAVIGPYEVVEKTLSEIDGYVVAANLNSHNQTVIGGTSEAVKAAIDRFNKSGLKAMRIPVSHAFHTQIVASAARPMRQVLDRLELQLAANPRHRQRDGRAVSVRPGAGQGLPRAADRVAGAVGARVSKRCTPAACASSWRSAPRRCSRASWTTCSTARPDLVSLFTNHPDFGEIAMFNQALCGLYAAGYDAG